MEWPEDWYDFMEKQKALGLNMSIGMVDDVVVESPTDAVLKGFQNWLLVQGNFDYSYTQIVMHELEPFYEVIPAIDYSAE